VLAAIQMAMVLELFAWGPAGPSELAIQARVVRVDPCANVPDDLVTLAVDIAVTVRNETDGILILARRTLTNATTKLAANAEKAKEGKLEVDIGWTSTGPPQDTRPPGGAEPDTRRVLALGPGQTGDLYVGTTVFVDRLSRTPVVGAVAPGTSHVIQIEAYWDASDLHQAESIQRRRRLSGELFRGGITTPFIPLDVPREFPNLPRCSDAATP